MTDCSQPPNDSDKPRDQHLEDDGLDQVVRVVMRGDDGKIAREWSLNEERNFLGSGSRCQLRIEDSPLADCHAELIVSPKQILLRALAPNVRSDAGEVNEQDSQKFNNWFEVAGLRFELLGGSSLLDGSADTTDASTERPTPDGYTYPADGLSSANIHELAGDDPELHEILETLTDIQADSRRAYELKKELLESEHEAEDGDSSGQLEPFSHANESGEPVQDGEPIATRQPADLEKLSERASDVNKQLEDLEHLVSNELIESEDQATSQVDTDESNATCGQDSEVAATTFDSSQTSEESNPLEGDWQKLINTQVIAMHEAMAGLVVHQGERFTTMSEDRDSQDSTSPASREPNDDSSATAIRLTEEAARTVESLASQTTGILEQLAKPGTEDRQNELQRQFQLLRETVDQAAAAILGGQETAEQSSLHSVPVDFEQQERELAEHANSDVPHESNAGEELPSWWTAERENQHNESIAENAEVNEFVAGEPDPTVELNDEPAGNGQDAPALAYDSEQDKDVFETDPTPDMVDDYNMAGEQWHAPTQDGAPHQNSPDHSIEEADQKNFFSGMGESESSHGVTPQTAEAADEEESVEEYMQKLLARMRGTPEQAASAESPPAKPAAVSAESEEKAAQTTNTGSEQPSNLLARLSESDADASEASPTSDPKIFSPRANAPEHTKNLAALRELANSSARTAIHKSTRQRQLLNLLMKGSIAVIGLLVGLVLLSINGFSVNLGLIATIAAFFVAGIWGYDFVSTLRPLLQAGIILPAESSEPVEVAKPEAVLQVEE